jgi:hypothetical protein
LEKFSDIPRGIFLIRGENVVLAGEVDEMRDIDRQLTRVIFWCGDEFLRKLRFIFLLKSGTKYGLFRSVGN